MDCLHFRDRDRNSNLDLSRRRYCSDLPYDADNSSVSEQDISQTLTGVTDLHWEMKGSPIVYTVHWKVVSEEERVPIRFRARND